MSEYQESWLYWARVLQRWGIKNGVATLLEIAGSLTMVMAQILYLFQPTLSGAVSSSSLRAIARILESPDDRLEFITFLRKATPGGRST